MNLKRENEIYRLEHYDGSLLASSLELLRMSAEEVTRLAIDMAKIAGDLPVFLVGEVDGHRSYYECVYSDGSTRIFEN